MKNFSLFYPLKPFQVTQTFGANQLTLYKDVLGLKGHNGLDCVANTGKIVRAAHDGTVTFAGEDGSAGFGIVIRTDEEFEYGAGTAFWKSIYWHLKSDGIKCKAGQKVKAGDIIALSNNTGMSTGPHLHFGIKPCQKGEADWQWSNIEQNNGYQGAVDPTPYFNGQYAEDLVFNKLSPALRAMAEQFKAWFHL